MTCLHDRSASDPTGVLHSRRGIVTGLGAAAVLAAARPAVAAEASADDEEFMRMALAEARQADFPFDAVIVRDGEVIAAAAISDGPTAIRPRTAKWWRSAAALPTTAVRRSRARRSIRPENRA
jgi:hypothetical protein